MSNNIIMPKLGMTMTEGTVEEWHKQEGDTVESGEAILTISSEKLTQDIESPATGTLLEIKVQESENTEVKSVLGIIGESGESTDTETTNETTDNPNEDESSDSNDSQENSNSHITSKNPTEDEQNSETRIFISPLARNMANDNGLNITTIKGTGGNGRITKIDINRVLENGDDKESYSNSTSENLKAQTSTDNASSIGEGLNPMRKSIAQNMRQSLDKTAQLTLHRKANFDQLLAFKDKLNEELNQAGQEVKVSVTALIAKAVVLSLTEYQPINARYEQGELTRYDNVNLGIATSLDDGLMVPVIEKANEKGIGSLAKSIKINADAVRDGDTSQVKLDGATFTITNMGASGIEYFTPILNLGETGILGVGDVSTELILEDENIKQISRLPLSLTFDHQILDGASASDFLKILVKNIESPYLLII